MKQLSDFGSAYEAVAYAQNAMESRLLTQQKKRKLLEMAERAWELYTIEESEFDNYYAATL